MRRATGPGKVRNVFLPNQTAASGFAASLFNFDIDDATVKREHQDWLNSVLVPRLKAAPSPVRLVGSASRSGTAGHDRALSEQRVNAVRDHLLRRGVSQAFLTTAFTGKDLSVAGRDEDEVDRAVLVVVEGLGSVFPRFDRVNAGGKNDGFEKRHPFGGVQRPVKALGVGEKGPNALPLVPSLVPSKIVGVGRDGQVVARNAVGFFAASGDPDVAFVVNPTAPAIHHVFIDKNPQIIPIHGVTAGDAFIFLNPFGPSRPDERITVGSAVLQVTVLPAVTIKVMFHFVTGPTGVATSRQTGAAKDLLEDLNLIYTPQTNITFKPFGGGFSRHSIAGLTKGGVRVKDFKAIAEARDKGADLNIFFVEKVINTDGPTLSGFSTIPGEPGDRDARISIVDDNRDSPDPDEELIAHEVAHTLGQKHDKSEKLPADERTIMAQPRPTELIPRAMAKRMHEHLKRFPVR
jgi:hypothetical protein